MTGKRALAVAIAILAVLACAGAAYWYRAARDDGRARAIATSEPPTIAEEGGSASAHNRPAKPKNTKDTKPLPSAEVPSREAVRELLPLAQAGDADAMHDLALRLMRCSRVGGSADETLQDNAVRRFYWNHGHEPANEDEIAGVAAQVENDIALREECRGLDPALVAARIGWLEKSALAGNHVARLEYAKSGLQDMLDREDILMHPEEVDRRRELAGDLLQQALADGDCEALEFLAQAYGGQRGLMDWIYAPDAAKAAAYTQANYLWRTGGAAPPDGDPFADGAGFALSIEPAALEAARRQGQAIYQRYCADGPQG